MGSGPKAEFGDFQTPPSLAATVAQRVRERLPRFETVLEPTCGVGNLLAAVRADRSFGVELNPEYATRARKALPEAEILCQDFFQADWPSLFQRMQPPLLVLGNPPWVTTSDLGALQSLNRPPKTQKFKGLDALTGKSNFDISEVICLRMLELMPIGSAFAWLIKTSVARRILRQSWQAGVGLRAEMFLIDAKRHFGASVDACLFLGVLGAISDQICLVYDEDEERVGCIGYEDGKLLADADARAATKHLDAPGKGPLWRSGVKHDCAAVLELRPTEGGLQNGLGELVNVESEFVFPLQKSSDVAAGRGDGGKRVILPQRTLGQETASLEGSAPLLWSYLQAHRERFRARKSRIYQGKPDFSIFGVGPYTFTPWKVAISGLYKSLNFQVVGPVGESPVVFDDTVYCLPFETKEQAVEAHRKLTSKDAVRYFEAFIFWDAKRPITASLLRRLDFGACQSGIDQVGFELAK